MATPKAKFAVVGTRARMVDALDKVTGRSKYADDLPVPKGALYARVLRSPHAHACILKVDTSRASALPA